MSRILLVGVPLIFLAVASLFIYVLFLAGRIGPAFRVSADGAEHICWAFLVGPTTSWGGLAKVVVASDSVTAYAPFFSAPSYRRGHGGFSRASSAWRVHVSQIRGTYTIGKARGVKIIDTAGNSVRLYGSGVTATLGILGSGHTPSGYP